MKILLLLPDLFGATGGIQTFNRSLVKAIDHISFEKEWKVSVLVLNDKGEVQKSGAYYNKRSTHYRGFGGNKLAFILNCIREGSTASIAIIGHVNFAPLVLAMRARNRKLHFLLMVFGIDVWKKLSRMQQSSIRRMHCIVSISRSTRDKMNAVNGPNRTPVEILPCTVDPLYGQNVVLRSRAALGLPEGSMILSTARLDDAERYKGIDVTLHAMRRILDRIPQAFYVVVGDGSDRHRLEALAGELRIAHRVFFKGRVEEDLLASFYETSDLFVLPSTGEGFGIVFLEAMFYGKCCIGAKAGATPEVIEDGVTGLLVEPNQPEALAESVITLMLDTEKRTIMGNAGRNRAAREFSSKMFVERLKSILALN